MSIHGIQSRLHSGNPTEVTDPGTGKAIVVDRYNQCVPLTIAANATETNTLAAPTRDGQRLRIIAVSVGSSGTRAVTVASAINAASNTIITFDAVGDMVVLESFPISTTAYAWRVIVSNGSALS